MSSDDLRTLPADLPVPLDDGGCDHLAGLRLPHAELASTAGHEVDLAALSGTIAVYCYSLTGRPDRALPQGWNEIPGARGCTPQSCEFRDRYPRLQDLGVEIFGLSTQVTEYQQEVVERLHLPFALLSDAKLEFARALRLPTFDFQGMTLIKRLTLIVADGRIVKVFYPVFPPDTGAQQVADWVAGRRDVS